MLFATQLIFVSGGPAGVIWGFVIVWVGTLSTFAVIAELVSMLVLNLVRRENY